jgi:DNA-binding PucR family transcriptional regulator
VRVGSTGLRATGAEARAAVAAARAGRRRNAAVPYDEVGLQRTIIEWYASDAAREAVDSLLSPLDTQKPAKREASIRTLQSYLDHEGSLVRAAEDLHMHRNAVAYRIDRIFEALGVDRADPDTRLLLQLACRARSLG